MYSALIWTHCEVYWALDFEPFENEWRAASGIEGLCCVAWRLFFWLIIFVFVDFRIFYERFIPQFLWSFLFSVNLKKNARNVDIVAKPPWFHWLFFLRWIWQPWTVPSQNCMWKICQKKTAGEKTPSQYCRWKICRWEGAIPILPTVAKLHPKTADEACNLDWRPVECQCVASSGTVFGALWFCPAPEHFYSRNPSSKTSLVRQDCSISVWTCSEFLSLRTRFYRRAGPVVFYSHQSCLPYGGPLCENLTLHNGNLKKNNPNLFYYLE